MVDCLMELECGTSAEWNLIIDADATDFEQVDVIEYKILMICFF